MNRWMRAAFLASLCLVAAVADGQNRPLERAADRMDRLEEARRAESGDRGEARDDRSAATAPEADRTPLGVDVASIHLIPDQALATLSAAPGGDPVVVHPAVPAPETLPATLAEYVGKPMSMALLAEIAREIVLAWRESDYPLVDVYYPEQNITGGKLQIVVKEAVLGEKYVEGAVVSKENYLLSQLRLHSGDRISRRVVESDLDWLNRNPIRDVNVIYERGEGDGASDIRLDVTEVNSVTAYSGFANTGVDFTGEEEWSFGFQLFNPGGKEHTVGYHYATDLEWDNLSAHSLFYEAFLPWRHSLSVFGAHVESESRGAAPIQTEGTSRQLSFEYEIPLERPRWNRRWRHSVSVAFDYKSTNTDLIFGGTNFFGTEVEVGQFRGEYEFRLDDKAGFTRGQIGIVGSPGGIFTNNDDASFNAARFGSRADYSYVFGELERIHLLPSDFRLRFRMLAQSTTDRLAATEQLLAGGYRTVRGFDESVVRGDGGVMTTLELISPAFSASPALKKAVNDRWNALLFYDAAALRTEGKVPGEVSPSIQSLGVGLQCRFGDHGFARASYGWALQSHGLLPTDNDDGKFHFGVTMIY